jgi:predicted small lipoprotein YifL
MRLFLLLMPLLLLAASATGCGSKSPAASDPPPGVIANPNRPDVEAIKKRKQMLIDPRKGGAPAPSDGKR